MELKLLENLDKMIWENIMKASDKELNDIEETYNIVFPKEDRKYLKFFNLGKAVNIIFNIEDEKFYLKFDTLEYKYFSENLKYFHRLTGNYFENRKIIPIISNTKFLIQQSELKEFIVAYDFTNNIDNPEIIFITYKGKDTGETYQRYKYIENSVTEKN